MRAAVDAWNGKFAVMLQQVAGGSDTVLAPLAEYGEYQIAYQVHPWVYACTRVIATNGASAQLQAYERKMFTQGSGGNKIEIKQAIPEHPMTQLLRHPNEAMALSRYDLLNLTLGYLELTGNAYWYLQRGKTGMAEQIIPLRPDRVTPVPDKNRFVEGYIYRVDGAQLGLKAADVVHVKYFNPYNDYLGQPTLGAARTTLNEDVLAQRYNSAFLRNGSRPGGAISYDQQLTEEDYKRTREQWEKAHRGADNAHRVAIFERGAKWEALGISQKDSDFIAGRKLNREMIAGVFGVPPVLINSYEHANYNTAKTQTQVFWRITMQPKLVLIAEALTSQRNKFMGQVQAATSSMDWFMDWDTSQVWAIMEELRDGVESTVKLVNNGLYNHNEARADFYNKPPVDGGEHYFRPSGQTLLEDVSPGPADAGDSEEEEEPDDDAGDDDKGRIVVTREGSVEQREDEWKATIVQTEVLEKAFAKLYRAILSDQQKTVIANLHAFDRDTGAKRVPRDELEVESILFRLEAATELTDDVSVPLYERIMAEGGARGASLARLGFNLDMDNPTAQAMLRDMRQKFSKSVSNTTWTSLKNDLIVGMKEGDGIVALAGRVGNVMGTRRVDSLQIARTEVIGAYNGGLVEVWNQSETVTGKGWLTAGDEHVRESHEDLDGEVRSLNGSFEVYEGAALRYPGDPAGAASEIINCRCSLTPAMEGF